MNYTEPKPKFLLDRQGNVIAVTWDQHPVWITDGKEIGLAPLSPSTLAHDGNISHAMPANPGRWLNPV